MPVAMIEVIDLHAEAGVDHQHQVAAAAAVLDHGVAVLRPSQGQHQQQQAGGEQRPPQPGPARGGQALHQGVQGECGRAAQARRQSRSSSTGSARNSHPGSSRRSISACFLSGCWCIRVAGHISIHAISLGGIHLVGGRQGLGAQARLHRPSPGSAGDKQRFQRLGPQPGGAPTELVEILEQLGVDPRASSGGAARATC